MSKNTKYRFAESDCLAQSLSRISFLGVSFVCKSIGFLSRDQVGLQGEGNQLVVTGQVLDCFLGGVAAAYGVGKVERNVAS